MIVGTVETISALLAVIVAVGCPVRRHGNGRHVSRPVGRRLGWSQRQLHFMQVVLISACFALVMASMDVAWVIGNLVFVVWVGDDWFTGGDDDRRRRRRAWARVKIRMPKPAKIRPVERAPLPA